MVNVRTRTATWLQRSISSMKTMRTYLYGDCSARYPRWRQWELISTIEDSHAWQLTTWSPRHETPATLYKDHNITCEFDGCLTDGGWHSIAYLLVIVTSPAVLLHSASPAAKPKQRSDQRSPRLSRTSNPSNTFYPVAN
jgi:hypothetical protein